MTNSVTFTDVEVKCGSSRASFAPTLSMTSWNISWDHRFYSKSRFCLFSTWNGWQGRWRRSCKESQAFNVQLEFPTIFPHHIVLSMRNPRRVKLTTVSPLRQPNCGFINDRLPAGHGAASRPSDSAARHMTLPRCASSCQHTGTCLSSENTHWLIFDDCVRVFVCSLLRTIYLCVAEVMGLNVWICIH